MAGKSKRPKQQRMIDLPLEEQDARAERFQIRALVREANERLVEMLRQWANDMTPDYERFHAEGHKGQYHELPIGTLARKLFDLGWTQQAIQDALQKRETPLNFMSTEELGYVYQRIKTMIQYFESQPPGTFAEACEIYQQFGELVRQAVLDKTGHKPESFATPKLRITGAEAPSAFAPTVYRAPLFPQEEDV